MNIEQLIEQYLTKENIIEYAAQVNKMVWVSDLTGYSVDDNECVALDLKFWRAAAYYALI